MRWALPSAACFGLIPLAPSGLLMVLPALGLLTVPGVRNLTRPAYVYDGHMVV
jgi:hypothetical protein